MNWFRIIAPILLAGRLASGAAISDPATPEGGSGSGSANGPVKLTATLPPVLRPLEPAESRRLVLPGPPKSAKPTEVPHPHFQTVAPVAKMALLPTKLAEDPILRRPLPRIPVSVAAPVPVPVSAPAAKPPMPPDLEREIALYCQKQIGHWTESDARAFLGQPKRQRPAYDEKRSVNGTIYAFSDPTGRYQNLELDFDREAGTLRTVFCYPPHLTWQDCRRLWAGPFTSADAKQGRMFYSYTNRRLDVLVDAAGKVVSLGWY
jgi:hypothetical protein